MCRPSQLELDALRQRQLAGPVERVGLPAHVGLPRVAARFAAAPGILLAAEGAADLGATGADIDVGDAAIAAALAEEGLRRNQVGGEQSRREALRHVVVPVDGFVELVELDQVKDGREDLLLKDRHAGLGAHQRWLHIAALERFAAEEDLGALLAHAAEPVQHILHGAAVDQRSHDGPLVERMSDAHLPVGADQRFGDPPRDAALQEEAARGGAALSRRAHGAKQNGAQHQVGIGIVHHDDAVVAAQFQDGAAQPPGHLLGDVTAHFGGPGKADQRNARVAHQTFGHRPAGTDDQVEHPLQAVTVEDPVDDLLHRDGHQRRIRRGTPEHAIAAHRRDHGVPRPHRHREVEGADYAHDAERVPLLVHAMPGALAVHGEAVKLAREADGEIGDIDHFLHFTQAFGQDLAHLQGDESAQVPLMGAQLIADLAHDFAALGSRHHAPFDKGFGGARHHGLVIGGWSVVNHRIVLHEQNGIRCFPIAQAGVEKRACDRQGAFQIAVTDSAKFPRKRPHRNGRERRSRDVSRPRKRPSSKLPLTQTWGPSRVNRRISHGTIALDSMSPLLELDWARRSFFPQARATAIAPKTLGHLPRTNTNMKRSHMAVWMFSIVAVVTTGLGGTPPKPASVPEPKAKSELLSLPLSFEANRGQTDPAVKFFSRGDGYALFLTPDSAVFKLRSLPGTSSPAVVRMKLAGANSRARISGAEMLPGTVNYFIGNDPSRWTKGVSTFGRVNYRQTYPGIDLVYYGTQRQLEYDFIVTPGADPNRIALEFSGARPMLGPDGDLVLMLDGAPLTFRKPMVYQTIAGKKEMIEGNYKLSGDRVRFALGEYDHSRALVIDPVLVYMTYLGGSSTDMVANMTFGGNTTQGMAVDPAGNVYVTGSTQSLDFPVQGAIQPANTTNAPTGFVSKLNPAGSQLIYSTYIGGGVLNDNSITRPYAIVADSSGSAYVTGFTSSIRFPVTAGAYQMVCGALVNSQTNCPSAQSAFLTKLSPNGSLVYSTFLGHSNETAVAVAVDSRGQAYVAGNSVASCFSNGPATCFPTTANSVMPGSTFNTTLNPGNLNQGSAFIAVLK